MATLIGILSPGVLSTTLRTMRSLNSALKSPSLTRRTKKAGSKTEPLKAYIPPLELLEYIIELYVEDCFDQISERTGLSYGKLASLTLTSKQLRHVTLRIYFRSLYLMGPQEDEPLQDRLLEYLRSVASENKNLSLVGGYSWVRSLSITSRYCSGNSLSHTLLSSLNGLKILRVDLMHERIATQHSFLTDVLCDLNRTPAFQNLFSLSLTCVPWISKNLLLLVGQAAPSLAVLEISSPGSLKTDCCPTCYEESVSRVFCSPIPDVSPDVHIFGSMIGTALSPLKRLTHLYLGLFLSPSTMLESHLEHTCVSRDWSFSGIYNCKACSIHKDPTKIKELTATTIIAEHLTVVEVLCWDSCFEDHQVAMGEGEVSAKARFSISRGSGEATVTRLPSSSPS